MGLFFSKSFNARTDIPSLSDKIAIVTGANTGLGYHTALTLASHGAKVYLACRSESKALAAIKQMETEDKSLVGTDRLVWLSFDLGSLKKARQAAEDFLSRESRLDILINNAAIGAGPYALTDDGYESSLGGNHLAHFVFTTTLLPTLTSTSKLPGSDVRIITLTSGAHAYAPKGFSFATKDDFKKLYAPEAKKDTVMNGFARYGLSKLANLLFMSELQRRLDAEGTPIIAMSVHPGIVLTDGGKKVFDSLGVLGMVAKPFLIMPEKGATNSLFAAASPQVRAEAGKWKGGYIVPYCKIGKTTKEGSDEKLAKELWGTTEEIVGEVLGKP